MRYGVIDQAANSTHRKPERRRFSVFWNAFLPAVVLACAALALMNRSGKIDAVAWTEQGTIMVNWLCGGVSLLGLIVQYLLDRRRQNRSSKRSGRSNDREISLPLPLLGWSLKAQRKAG